MKFDFFKIWLIMVVLMGMIGAGRIFAQEQEAQETPDECFWAGNSLMFPEEGAADYEGVIEKMDCAIAGDIELLGWAYYYRGIANQFLYRYNHALEDFSLAIQTEPDQVCRLCVLSARAGLYEFLGREDLALDDYRRMTDIEEVAGALHLNMRGRAYARLGEYDPAMQDIEQALLEDPYNVISLNDRGYIYYHTNKFILAVADYQYAISLAPGYTRSYRDLGTLYYENGLADEALEHYCTYRELAKGHIETFIAERIKELGRCKNLNVEVDFPALD